MNKKLKSILQVLLSLALGFFLIWIIYKDLTEEDKQNIIESFREANYWWILLSMVIAITSHVFRAYRWRYPLESLNIHINLPNRFAAVMIGYLANLAFPRLGEVTRCAVLTRYQKHPFEKLFGTVVAERVVDAIILVFIMIFTSILQIEILSEFLADALGPLAEKSDAALILIGIGVLGLGVAYLGWRFLNKSTHKFAVFFREKVHGLMDGMKSIKRMKGQLGFYFHTAMIWIAYVVMYYVALKAFPETAEVPFGGVMASFALGGLTIVAVQGGLGAYPLAVMAILLLYGINKDLGYAFGWIIWTGQTLAIILVGFLSVLAMPLLNSKQPSDV
ncbi:MAG: lysylphosphatidylglycerol synthase transmembrane domain-containing protein [Flavobacteriales bacterium]